MKIDYQEALGLLKRAVEEKGEDYVYGSVERNWCVYFSEKDRSPSCIVGHVLHYKGVELSDLEKTYSGNTPLNVAGVYSLSKYKVLEPEDDRTEALLTAAQDYQDNGIPWGQALSLAITDSEAL